jgi:hypothetical protein
MMHAARAANVHVSICTGLAMLKPMYVHGMRLAHGTENSAVPHAVGAHEIISVHGALAPQPETQRFAAMLNVVPGGHVG